MQTGCTNVRDIEQVNDFESVEHESLTVGIATADKSEK
jgi:hypothetical protein